MKKHGGHRWHHLSEMGVLIRLVSRADLGLDGEEAARLGGPFMYGMAEAGKALRRSLSAVSRQHNCPWSRV